MKSLYDYDYLVNDVFYKCQHILKYIERHKSMDELDTMAIKATIMDALVYKNLIDPKNQSLDLDNLSIVDNLNYYKYEEHPDVCGIPQWMKEEFRKKCLNVTGGITIAMFLAKPPSKITRFCVYDPNTAVSSIFSDATFYNVFYNSPTRNKRIEEKRPFVEVNINDELYLVDTLTKRIFKSSFFKEKYGFEIINQKSIHDFSKEDMKYYKELIADHTSSFSLLIPFFSYLSKMPNAVEMAYEFEKSKEYFPDEWKKAEEEWNISQKPYLDKHLCKIKNKNVK